MLTTTLSKPTTFSTHRLQQQTTRVSNPIGSLRSHASMSGTDMLIAFALGVLSYLHTFHRYT